MEDSTYVVIVSGDSDRSPKHFRTLRDARADADAHALYGNEAIVYKVGFTDPKAAIDAVHKGAGEEVYTGLLPNPRAAREDVDEPMAPPFQFPVQFIKDIAQQRPLRASLRLMRASDGPKIIKNALLKAFESYPSTVMGAAMIFGIVAITYIIDVINSIEWIGVLIRSPVASLLGVTVVLFAIALVPAVWVEVYQRLLGWPLYGRGKPMSSEEAIARVHEHIFDFQVGGPDREAEDIELGRRWGLPIEEIGSNWQKARKKGTTTRWFKKKTRRYPAPVLIVALVGSSVLLNKVPDAIDALFEALRSLFGP